MMVQSITSMLTVMSLVGIASSLSIQPTWINPTSLVLMDEQQFSPAPMFPFFDGAASKVMNCGDKGDSCVFTSCCDYAYCWGVTCHSRSPWTKKQLPPPLYKGEDVRIAEGEGISIEVYRKTGNGLTFQGYLTQTHGRSDIGVTSDPNQRGVFWVIQADDTATRLAAAVPPNQNDVYKLIRNDGDWVFLDADRDDKSDNTRLNFPSDDGGYYVFWFGTTQINIRGFAININSDGVANTKDEGYTAFMQMIRA